jgi:membrane protease YdiL (CAAX protease family)
LLLEKLQPSWIESLAGKAVYRAGVLVSVALSFAIQRHPAPWQAAASWWPADGVLANLLGLALLVALTRREGIGLWALASYNRRRLVRDVFLGLGLFLILFPVAIAGMILVGILFYGSYAATPIVGGHLPLWAGLVSLLIFPFINGVTEQMTYSAYALPRVEVLTGKAFLAVAIVAFWFAFQHIALGLLFDWRFILYRFFSFLPLCIIVLVLYLKLRRLTSLIVCHWCLDLVGSVSLMLMP